jgi:hypothetical protein
MSHPHEASLLSQLPGDVAALLRDAFVKTDGEEAQQGVYHALRALGFPDLSEIEPFVLPLATSLTPAQRTAAEVLAFRETWPFDLPASPANRRHWLGLDGQNALDVPIKVTRDGKTTTEPLWRGIQIEGSEALARVPVGAAAHAYALERKTDMDWYAFDHIHHRLKGEARPWVAAYADQILKAAEEKRTKVKGGIRWVAFLGLVRAGIPIEPRWDSLFPIEGKARLALTRECLAALPPRRRSAAILHGLEAAVPYENVAVALALLPGAPSRELADWIANHADHAARMTKRDVLSALGKVKIPEVAGVHTVATKGQRPLRKLTYVKDLTPVRLSDLSAIQQKQLRAAGKAYDGQDLPAEQRIGAKDKGRLELLEVGRLVDADGDTAYDAILYMADSGTIFQPRTTKKVADIIQDGVECSSEALGEAVEHALKDRGATVTSNQQAPKKARAKKTLPGKPTKQNAKPKPRR